MMNEKLCQVRKITQFDAVLFQVSLAASINLRTTLTWEELTNDTVELHLHNLRFSSSWTTKQIKDVQLSSSGKLEKSGHRKSLYR